MMVRVDPDDAAPGAFAHHWTEFVELEAVAEDVAVRACELVGQRDHRAADRFWRIGLRGPVPRDIVADAFTGELLEE